MAEGCRTAEVGWARAGSSGCGSGFISFDSRRICWRMLLPCVASWKSHHLLCLASSVLSWSCEMPWRNARHHQIAFSGKLRFDGQSVASMAGLFFLKAIPPIRSLQHQQLFQPHPSSTNSPATQKPAKLPVWSGLVLSSSRTVIGRLSVGFAESGNSLAFSCFGSLPPFCPACHF